VQTGKNRPLRLSSHQVVLSDRVGAPDFHKIISTSTTTTTETSLHHDNTTNNNDNSSNNANATLFVPLALLGLDLPSIHHLLFRSPPSQCFPLLNNSRRSDHAMVAVWWHRSWHCKISLKQSESAAIVPLPHVSLCWTTCQQGTNPQARSENDR
jgi:hypothetical protein